MDYYLRANDIAVRNDTGARVRILEVRPIADRVFYKTEDCQDGHTTVIEHVDLRPALPARKGAEHGESQ